jgi:hypothetical protein
MKASPRRRTVASAAPVAVLAALSLAACAGGEAPLPGGAEAAPGTDIDIPSPDSDTGDGVTRSSTADGLSMTVTLDTDGAVADPAVTRLSASYEVTNTGSQDMLLIRGIGTANPTEADLAADPASLPSAVELEGGVAWLTSRSVPATHFDGFNARGIVLAPGETYVGTSFADMPLALPDGSDTPTAWGVCIEYGTAADGGATTTGRGRDLGTAPSTDGSGSFPLVLLDIVPTDSITATPPPITTLCSPTVQGLPSQALGS